MDELKLLIEKQNAAFAAFKSANEANHLASKKEIELLQREIDGVQKRAGRPVMTQPSSSLGMHSKAELKEIDQFLRGKVGSVGGQKSLAIGGLPEDGGYADTEEVQPTLLPFVAPPAPMRGASLVTKRHTDNPEQIVDIGGGAVGRVGETDARPETAASKLGSVKPAPGEYYANPRASQKMVDDAFFDVAGWASQTISRLIANAENTDFTIGDGVGKPKGFLAYTLAANPTFGQIKQIKSGVIAQITADKLIEVANEALLPGYVPGASWMMPRSMLRQIRQLKDGNGRYLFDPESRELLGHPIVLNDDMPAPGAASKSLAFGDFKRGYWIADHVAGTRVTVDPYSAKPFVQYYATKRTAGAVLESQALCVVTLEV